MKAIGKNIVITPIKENGVKTSGGLLLAEVNREQKSLKMILLKKYKEKHHG